MGKIRQGIIAIMLLASVLGINAQEITETVEIEEITPSDSVTSMPERVQLNVTSTPVDIDRDKPEGPVMHYYDKHGNPLEQPVRFLAELDTVTNVKSGPVYPAYNGVSIGINFFDGLMAIFGQKRGSIDLHANCSIYNWLFPTVEVGLGYADAHPDDGRCHFKVKPSLYARIGMNYNFLYKSNPDYKAYIGLRAGMSSFNYDIYAITAGSEYYREDGPSERTGLHGTCWYGQALAGVEVKIWRGISMGWSVRYGFNIKKRYSDPEYPAWFIPGYGTGPLSATFSVIYRL